MNDKLREANIELGLWCRWHFDEACRLKRLSRKGPRTRETIAYHQRRTEAIGLVADKLRAALADTADAETDDDKSDRWNRPVTADAPPEVTEEMERAAYDAWQKWLKAGRGSGFKSVKIALCAALAAAHKEGNERADQMRMAT